VISDEDAIAEIKSFLERLARGENCSEWTCYYRYAGNMLCEHSEKPIRLIIFNDCDEFDYIDTIEVNGKTVYKYGVPRGDGEWDWDVAVSPEWKEFGLWANDFVAKHNIELSRSMWGNYYIHEDHDPSRIRVTLAQKGDPQ